MQQSLSSLVDPINRLWQPVAFLKARISLESCILDMVDNYWGKKCQTTNWKSKWWIVQKQWIYWFCCCPCLCWICKVFPPPLVGWQNTGKFVICINTFTDTGHFTSNIWHHHSFSMKTWLTTTTAPWASNFLPHFCLKASIGEAASSTALWNPTHSGIGKFLANLPIIKEELELQMQEGVGRVLSSCHLRDKSGFGKYRRNH